MGGNGGVKFAAPPTTDLPLRTGDPVFNDLVPMGPRIEEPLVDVGGGDGNAIFNALSHFADDDDLAPIPTLSGMMLAQGSGSGGATAAPPRKESSKPPRKKASVAPAKQRDAWDKVRDTTDGKPGGYDIGWMKKLDPRVLKSIEGPYADDVADTAIAARMRGDPQIAKIEASRKKTTRDIRKANKTTQKRGAKEVPSDPLADSVDAAFDAQRALRENEIRSQMENDVKRGAPKQTVSVPGKNEKVRRADMQTVKRVNYVSDVNTLSGDHAKTRKHLESIRAVKGTDMKDGKKNPHAMLLSGDTADRFEMLRDKFDKDPAHAGMRMPVTSVGFGTRGLHEEKRGLGYLGHMLGTTMDLFAYENPNLKADDVEGVRINRYMLERFGRDEKGNNGRAMLENFGDDRIEAMGKRTAAGVASADDDELEKKIRGQYREMSATSDRFKGENSLGKDKMTILRAARTRYFALEKKREEAASVAAELEKAPNDASLKTKLESLQATNDAQDSLIRAYMDAAFKPWKDELQADIEKTQNDTSKDEAYRKNEIDVLQRTRRNFEDPARVFGREGKNGNAKPESSSVPIMQYLEKGFIRDDGTEYAALRKQGKRGEVFNEDVFATLMRHGFASGSHFGDTMHFDFVESQSNLVPGGRNRINMNKDRASPENELPDVVNVPSTPTRTTAPPKGSVFDKPSPLPPVHTPRPVIELPHPLAPPPTLLDQE